jgi:hypothetical protein
MEGHVEKMAVLTSEFHMPRTKSIYEYVFGLPHVRRGISGRSDRSDAGQASEMEGAVTIDADGDAVPVPVGVQVETSVNSNNPSTNSSNSSLSLSFVATPNTAMTDEERVEREKREAKSLVMWEETKKRFNTMAEMHQWFFSDHLAYSVNRMLVQQEEVSDTVKALY